MTLDVCVFGIPVVLNRETHVYIHCSGVGVTGIKTGFLCFQNDQKFLNDFEISIK